MIGSLRFLGNREFVPRDKFTDFQAQQLCFSFNLLQQNRQLLVGTLIQGKELWIKRLRWRAKFFNAKILFREVNMDATQQSSYHKYHCQDIPQYCDYILFFQSPNN